MNNAVSGKTIENARKHKYIKRVTTERRNCLVSDPNYDTTKFFTENLSAIEIKKIDLMNKSVHLGLKVLMYEYWCDYVKPKYGEKTKLCCGYRQFACLHKNRGYLQRCCKKC